MKSYGGPTVLAVGSDAVLLHTRAAVLRTAGFQVVVAPNRNQAKLAAGYFAFQAAVLCHSLNAETQDALAVDLDCCSRRKLPIMKLQPNECGPASLIESVRALVGKYKATYPPPDTVPTYEPARVRG